MVMQLSIGRGYFSLVDDEVFAFLSQWTWNHVRSKESGLIYARRNVRVNGTTYGVMLHRQIIGAPAALQVDHINCNSLDNRLANLRLCTGHQNARNRPLREGKLRGIMKLKTGWYGIIGHKGSTRRAGPFATPEDAAKAYDKMAVEIGGSFSRLNFPAEATQ